MRRFHLFACAIVCVVFSCGAGFADSTVDFGQLDKRHDVSPGYFLQFAEKGVTSFSIDSERGSWAVFGSNTLGQKGTLLTHGTGDKVFDLSSFGYGYAYLLVTGRGRGHVDLDDAAVGAVPEPGSPALILTTGLIGLAEMGRRRLMALLS
jgi:hypothetical protein